MGLGFGCSGIEGAYFVCDLVHLDAEDGAGDCACCAVVPRALVDVSEEGVDHFRFFWKGDDRGLLGGLLRYMSARVLHVEDAVDELTLKSPARSFWKKVDWV